jgi:thiamine biosynthesis lipoprotein ApbE
MGLYIQLSILRINLLLCVTLAACRGEARLGISRAWPEMGTMMSAAVWTSDTTGAVHALQTAHDSVDRVDSLMQKHVPIAVIDSLRRELRRRTGVALVPDSIAPGYALDRAALALARGVDSALLDVGGQYLWIGQATHRAVGIADPDNTLRSIATVDLRGGSVRTAAQRNAPRGSVRSVTVLAPGALDANAWALVFFAWGCDRALREPQGLSVVCADSAGLRSTTDLRNRVSTPPAPAP